jgi:putative Holliday junction resolvase
MSTRTFLGFDFGLRNIGVAIGQEITKDTHGLTMIKAKNGTPNWREVSRLLQDWQPSLVVVGLPLNMDGTRQPIMKYTRDFARCLYNYFKIRVEFQDERLSTVEARSHLFNTHGYRSLKKSRVDSQAAAIILKCWLDNNL